MKIKKKGIIIIRGYQQKDYLVIEIEDDGAGIPQEHLDKIFDPFFTTKNVGEGTGLGLSVCSKIIENHNGKLEVESKVGQGSTFKVKLPILNE